MSTMKAVVIRSPGGPEVLKIESLPIPTPSKGQVLISVKAFGLNRSEYFTRLGQSPGVKFPRVLGIEAVGLVSNCPGGEFKEGDKVATAMGGMGREFDGGYAEFTLVPVGQVQKVNTTLGWEVLGAIPEMFQTVWGSLFVGLKLEKGNHLLVRGGTTSIGLTAAAMAKGFGCTVSATTRKKESEELLRKNGADFVFIDDGKIAEEVKKVTGGVDRVLELVGTTTLLDSLKCAKEGGIVCMTGIVGNSWTLDGFFPMQDIPNSVFLTTYSGGPNEFIETPLQKLIEQVEQGKLHVPIGKTFKMEEIREAHKCMDENRAGGKIVILT